jgi:hypothetical protein
MSANTLQRGTRITGVESQSVDFAIDAGDSRYLSARLRVDAQSGSTAGSNVFKIQHAALPNDDEFEDLLTFTSVAHDETLPYIDIQYTENFSRYLRWVMDTAATGLTGISFSIELILKK